VRYANAAGTERVVRGSSRCVMSASPWRPSVTPLAPRPRQRVVLAPAA